MLAVRAEQGRREGAQSRTSWVYAADYHQQNGSPRSTFKNNTMCARFIYKLLTPGPERISILLGKCFPLGSVSATAYRCSRPVWSAALLPLRRE